MKTINVQKQQGFTLIELMIVVAIIGILAAVAIPAYSDYTKKAQASEAFSLLDGLKTSLGEYYHENATFVGYDIPATANVVGKYVTGIVASGQAAASVTLTATLGGANAGSTVILTSTDGADFTCNTGTLATAYRPKACQ
jgi:type IV pilus assembly protein PilA